jgi:hypothetical protein
MPARERSLRIIVTGMVGAFPIGGVAWDYLQYPIGLKRLGHDVVYHEDSGLWPYHPVENTKIESASYSVDYIAKFFATYAPELRDRWHYRHLRKESFGLSESAFDDFAKTADLFLNVSAANFFPKSLGPHCVNAFLDTDPGVNQIHLSERTPWSANAEGWWSKEFGRYQRYLSYGENIGQPDCLVPDLGVDWIATRMPIVLSLWCGGARTAKGAPWSTVMTWNNFPGALRYRGQEYGAKHVEFEKIISLPRKTKVPLKLALGGAGPAERLTAEGWDVVDGPTATLTPKDYVDLILESRGEVSTAKNVYVAMRTGWFSCRTACYLASGRPAVVQDTGFAKDIRTGRGLIAFDTVDEAAFAIDEIERDYGVHAKAATEIAAEYFESDRVLARMIDDIFKTAEAEPFGPASA